MKRYSFKTLGGEHTLPIEVSGARQYIKFKKAYRDAKLALFETSDEKIQKGIEESDLFKAGRIKLVFSDQNGQVKKTKKGKEGEPVNSNEGEPKEYPEVSTFQQAKDVLSGEPYDIPATSPDVSTPEKIFAKAAELGVSFPNLKKED
ncbi:hypothetical protein D0T49_03450 [Paludibacter sp. 221]|uniref:hypothetical protein n=1 Tax=Paludibacter sp. 221 TaxID=2302939 RepID=UPI0013D0283C|nr:hypothetical protein [Paludibacter sp. 221]NDV46096.1 hypothetical protein [Paludibacter sp. 221]